MGSDNPRMTTQTLKVLSALMSSDLEELAGADIARKTKLASGTLYPILFRLEEAGFLTSRWEADAPRDLKRPRRRLYKITGAGARNAKLSIREFKAALGSLAWS